MNMLHIKYAVEVARVGSLNKAAQNLIIAQPNLSRSIKELEGDLGIKIFDRSSKGNGAYSRRRGVHQLCKRDTQADRPGRDDV